MNSAERVFAALQRKVPDRVPIMELSIDPAVARSLGYQSYVQLFDEPFLDAVLVNLLVDYPEGCDLVVPTGKTYKNHWGVTMRYTDEVMPMVVEPPIASPADLLRFTPPDPVFPAGYLEAVAQVVKRYKGKKAIVVNQREVFGDSWNLRGMETYLMDMIENPDLVRRISRMVVAVNKERCRQLIRAGVDIIFMGDDYAYKTGPLMSPRLFRELLLPGIRECVAAVKQEGGYAVKHTDGNFWSIIGDFVDAGYDCLGPLEPGAQMDLYEVKKRFGDRVAVLGNVDVDLLCRGSVADVRAETRRLIERVAPGGGYMLCSGNSITSAVRPENFMAMVEAGREFGAYASTPSA